MSRKKTSTVRVDVGGSPLSRLITKQIDQQEYLRQVNVERKRNGLPPMTPQSAAQESV
jgi:uncharacterized protein YkwD